MRVRNSSERYAVENAYFSPSILTKQDKNNGKFISIDRQIILRNLFLAAAHTREAIAKLSCDERVNAKSVRNSPAVKGHHFLKLLFI